MHIVKEFNSTQPHVCVAVVERGTRDAEQHTTDGGGIGEMGCAHGRPPGNGVGFDRNCAHAVADK